MSPPIGDRVHRIEPREDPLSDKRILCFTRARANTTTAVILPRSARSSRHACPLDRFARDFENRCFNHGATRATEGASIEQSSASVGALAFRRYLSASEDQLDRDPPLLFERCFLSADEQFPRNTESPRNHLGKLLR